MKSLHHDPGLQLELYPWSHDLPSRNQLISSAEDQRPVEDGSHTFVINRVQYRHKLINFFTEQCLDPVPDPDQSDLNPKGCICQFKEYMDNLLGIKAKMANSDSS